MKRILALTFGLTLLAAWSCAPPRPVAVQPPREVPPPPQRPLPQTEAQCNALLDALLPGIGAKNLVDRERPQWEFEDVCFRIGQPGMEAQCALLCKAMVARLGPETAQPARVWLLRQLERISGEESVAGLARRLDDGDPLIREHVRKTLQNNPSPAAAASLRAALAKTNDPAWQVALLNALGGRGDQESLDMFTSLAAGQDANVAAAAIAAMADLPGEEPYLRLLAVWRGEDVARHDLAGAALLRVGDRAQAAGDVDLAARAFGDLYRFGKDTALRGAALRGLVTAQPATAMSRLVPVIRGSTDPELKFVAVRLLAEVPGEPVTRRLINEIPLAPPDVQAILIDALTPRENALVKPPMLRSLLSTDEKVRIAALHAMETLGDASDAVLLASMARATTGAERDAARRALSRMHGTEVDAAILTTIPQQADAQVKAELIRGLADRNFKPAVGSLLNTARDADAVVRQAAFESLGRLADDKVVLDLLDLLVAETDADARTAAENAVVAVSQKIEDTDRRPQPVIMTLKLTGEQPGTGAARAALIRVLGRLQNPAALTTIRGLVNDQNADVNDAAVRALCQWETVGALDDLLAIARNSSNPAHRVLALRGYVRLVRLPSDRKPDQTLTMLKTAMELATSDEDRKLVLGALAGVASSDALTWAKTYVAQEPLRDEAVSTVATIAVAVAGEHRAAAQAALDDVLAAPLSEAARKRAEAARDQIRSLAASIMTWQYAGPFSADDKNYEAIFAEPFAPEKSARGVKWETLATSNKEKPWLFDLTRVGKGANCCVYVRTVVYSDKAQPAQLALGSDDGVRVWLDGKPVYSHADIRSLTPGEDKIDIDLKRGANPLMLKVVQGSGGWGFCCEIKDRDGNPIDGLKFKAE